MNSAQATGKTTVISTVTTIKTRSERVGRKKSTSKRSGKKKSLRKRYRHSRDEEMLGKFRTILREELHEKHAGHQEESFATALYHNFAHLKDFSKTKNRQGRLQQVHSENI